MSHLPDEIKSYFSLEPLQGKDPDVPAEMAELILCTYILNSAAVTKSQAQAARYKMTSPQTMAVNMLVERSAQRNYARMRSLLGHRVLTATVMAQTELGVSPILKKGFAPVEQASGIMGASIEQPILTHAAQIPHDSFDNNRLRLWDQGGKLIWFDIQVLDVNGVPQIDLMVSS